VSYMCSSTLLNKITNEVANNIYEILGDKLKKVILYGSYARGDYDNESDIDIMVLADVTDTELPKLRDKICHISSDVSLKNNITVSIFIKDLTFFNNHINVLPFYNNVMKEGVTIYG